MPDRHPLLRTSVAFASAAALLLVGCSSGDDSAGPTPSRTTTTPTPSPAETEPSATHTTPGETGTPSTAVPSRTATTPELSITTLHAGATISLPATIGYAVTGAHFAASAGYRLHLTLGGSGSYSLDLPIKGPTGTVTIPLDKMLPGKRDLTFTVVRAGGASAWAAQHAAEVADVTIYGPK
ncbi:hypothetical protein SRB17_76630 [Streptomyces sp. RB17]|uniref:hypothetical protein n=1 Tax=Streptomyces sp. RB17 TaxID=2585197 RepID=UPI0012971B8A|nr:hypothetical protein [Streptomyces sp. RB17]MQY39636.1 hypothetical protein [Streptomyces sp. RB17]